MNQSSRRHLVSTIFWICMLASTPLLPAQKVPATRKSAGEGTLSLLDRVVVVGASVSHGRGNRLSLATLLDMAITTNHKKVLNASVGLQFLDPIGFGEDQIDRCLGHRATLVIGIDFLFWYGYGPPFDNKKGLSSRLKKLELGLAQLDRLSCPVVVGDLPDMRDADKRKLSPALVPSPAVLAALNREIRAWAAKKKNVQVVPLAEWVRTLKAGKWKVPASADGKHPDYILPAAIAFQWDRLHPSRIGAIVLAGGIVTEVKKHFAEAAAGLGFDIWKTARTYGARTKSAE